MADNNNDGTCFAFATECVFRRTSGLLVWIGYEGDPMAKAVERCNERKATETDLIALSAFPVFDECNEAASPKII